MLETDDPALNVKAAAPPLLKTDEPKGEGNTKPAVPKAEAGAAAGAPNDSGVAAAGGADAEEAGSTLAVGAPKRPAEGAGLKGDAGIVAACWLSAAGFEEASGVGVVLASPDCDVVVVPQSSDVVVVP